MKSSYRKTQAPQSAAQLSHFECILSAVKLSICDKNHSEMYCTIALMCLLSLFPQGGEAAPGTGKEDKKKKKAEDEENTLDWWSRYYATKATMEKVSKECREGMGRKREPRVLAHTR